MQDTGFVRRCESIGNSGQKFNDLLPASLLRGDPVPERATVNQLSNQVLAAFELSRIVNRKEMRMIQRRCHPRFALEATARTRVRLPLGENLNRNSPIQLGIDGAIDHAHAALSNYCLQVVGTKLGREAERCS